MTGSLGTGSATMTFNDATNLFSWNISWSGLGAVSPAHFHGPALPNQNASPQVTITDLSSPSIGSATINATQAAQLLANLWYINLHTAAHPGGEIRGQVQVAEPATGLLLAAGAGLLALLGQRRSS